MSEQHQHRDAKDLWQWALENPGGLFIVKAISVPVRSGDCATKHDLEQLKQLLMATIADFSAAMTAFNDRIDVAVTDLQGDVKSLNDKITELQNSNGVITPADQALLDAIQARASGVATKLEALDALTPPVPPTA